MKKLLLFAVLGCVHLGANAQSHEAIDGQAPVTSKKIVVKKSEAQVLAQFIKNDLKKRASILSNSNELKAALKATFGNEVNITEETVVAHILKISNDENQSVTIRREALKVLHARIPAGHKLETQTTK